MRWLFTLLVFFPLPALAQSNHAELILGKWVIKERSGMPLTATQKMEDNNFINQRLDALYKEGRFGFWLFKEDGNCMVTSAFGGFKIKTGTWQLKADGDTLNFHVNSTSQPWNLKIETLNDSFLIISSDNGKKYMKLMKNTTDDLGRGAFIGAQANPEKGWYVSLDSALANPEKAEVLHLSNEALSKLPEELEKCTNLKELYLDGNAFTSLPGCIASLTKLEVLLLENNHLTALPEWVGKLQNLHTLHLGSNNFTQIPECVYEITGMKRLFVDHNRIEQLDSKLQQLNQLTELDLSFNPLTYTNYVSFGFKFPNMRKLNF